MLNRISASQLDSAERRKAIFLSRVLILRGLALACLLGYLEFIQSSLTASIVLNAIILNALAFGLSKTKFYSWGALFIVYEGLAGVGLGYAVGHRQDPTSFEIAPLWLFLGVSLGSLILSARQAILAALSSSLVLAFIVYSTQANQLELVMGIALWFVSNSFLILTGTVLRERAEQELENERAKFIQAAKMSTLGEMAGGVAHEINNPLTTISLGIDNVIQEIQINGDPRIVVEQLSQLQATVFRIANIIKALRTFSRDAQADPLHQVPLKKIVEDTLRLCRSKFEACGVRLEVIPFDETLKVEIQETQISQVLLSLLSNSFDAVQSSSEKWIRIEVRKISQMLELAVVDSGPGIPAHVREKMFQPFFTTKDIGKGSGLGLSVAKGVIEGHGGSILYDSNSVHTRFVICLPLSDDVLLKIAA